MRIRNFQSALIILFIILSATASIANDPASLSEGSVNLQFSTETYWGEFAPEHIIAVWAEDENGNFIRTLQIWSKEKRKHLVRWNNASHDNKVDAVTSATVKKHTVHNVSWDCADLNGEIIPDGTYKILIELTEDASEKDKKLGKYLETEFVKGGENTTKFYDEKYIKEVSLAYTFITSVNEKKELISGNSFCPNPVENYGTIKYTALAPEFVSITLTDVSGNRLNTLFEGYSSIGENNVHIDLKEYSSGIYFYKITSDNINISGKIIKR